jgi:predicted ATPase
LPSWRGQRWSWYPSAVRVAFSGTHRVGKTTLLEAVAERMANHEVIEEPYHQLEAEGHEFSDPPAAADFEHQLRRSVDLIAAAPRDALIDRCPLDFVAYLRALDDDFDVAPWSDAIAEAMAALDLVVVIPIETPDRIGVPAGEDRRLRRNVDDQIRALVLDDALGLGLSTIDVYGDLDQRVRQVLRACGSRSAPGHGR